MKLEKDKPIYTIGIAADLLGVCQATLRIWEKKGLIKPKRIGKDRYFSKNDISKLEHIKKILQKHKVNIEGVKKLIRLVPCWKIKKCSLSIRNKCEAYLNYKKGVLK